ncbi:MAG: protein kinase [Chloroflexi bacterium]|nr:protein kinase [Chloroflexota bacterium]
MSSDSVVLKLVEIAGPHATVTLARAKREVDLLGRVRHPNVVGLRSPLVEIGSPPRLVAWLEERLDGQDLGVGFGRRWSWAETRSLVGDVLEGLDALHSEKVVHRDLSPGNIRHTSGGRFVIMDPGIARWIEESSLTGAFDPGTPGYMSPEHVVDGVHPTAASDLFCLGILAYQALSMAQPIPFTGDRVDYADRLRGTQAESVASVTTGLSSDQCAFVDRLLKRQVARRFITVDEARRALATL